MTSQGKTWEGQTHRHERRGGIAAPPLPGLSPLFTGEENEARSGLGGCTLALPLQTGHFRTSGLESRSCWERWLSDHVIHLLPFRQKRWIWLSISKFPSLLLVTVAPTFLRKAIAKETEMMESGVILPSGKSCFPCPWGLSVRAEVCICLAHLSPHPHPPPQGLEYLAQSRNSTNICMKPWVTQKLYTRPRIILYVYRIKERYA